jgi:hypothetical protein
LPEEELAGLWKQKLYSKDPHVAMKAFEMAAHYEHSTLLCDAHCSRSHGFATCTNLSLGFSIPYGLWSAKIPSGGFQRNVTLLHSDRLPSEALCCGKIPSYFEALTDPRDKPIRLTFI